MSDKQKCFFRNCNNVRLQKVWNFRISDQKLASLLHTARSVVLLPFVPMWIHFGRASRSNGNWITSLSRASYLNFASLHTHETRSVRSNLNFCTGISWMNSSRKKTAGIFLTNRLIVDASLATTTRAFLNAFQRVSSSDFKKTIWGKCRDVWIENLACFTLSLLSGSKRVQRTATIFFPVAQQPYSCLRRLTTEVSGSRSADSPQ